MFLSTPPSESAPFYIEHYQITKAGGRFTPGARLTLSTTLRTSGLLNSLSDEGARTLLALLACLTPNGHLHPTLPEIAAILHVSERDARDRLNRLGKVQWQGVPLVQELPRETGAHAFSLTPMLVENRECLPAVGNSTPLPIPPPAVASREAIIENSRALYGTPRAEAERMVAEQLGHSPEEWADTPEGEVRRRLSTLGVSRDETERLLAGHTVDEIRHQLDWLSARKAKSPARFLVAAVEGNYAPPSALLPSTPNVPPSGTTVQATPSPDVPSATHQE